MRKISANIPFELQEEIIHRLPVKSLLKFRSVSKQWKSLIDSPDFSDLRQSQPRLLIRCRSYDTLIYKYVSVADNDTLHEHQFPLPKSVKKLRNSVIVGCSHGLFCFYGYDLDHKSYMAFIWNPSIRKSIDVPIPNVLFDLYYETFLGFGVSPQTKDPKIVKIINYCNCDDINTSVWQVEVFTLSSGTWKTPSDNFHTRNSIIFGDPVVLDGVMYWLAFELVNMDEAHNLIMSFDLSSEGFHEVCLPGNLARRKSNDLTISKRMESVVVLEMDETRTFYSVWMMGQGVTKSFTKLFNIMPRVTPNYVVCGFMKNGEPIVDHGSDSLFAYDPYSERIKRIKDLGIAGKRSPVFVEPYMETLLLIDH